MEGILTDANMTFTDDAMHEEMINELFARLDNYVAGIIVDNLPPANMDEFIKLNEEKSSQAEVETYLKEKVPNAQEILTKAFLDFRDTYLSNVTVARNAPKTESNMKGGNN